MERLEGRKNERKEVKYDGGGAETLEEEGIVNKEEWNSRNQEIRRESGKEDRVRLEKKKTQRGT